MLYVTNSPTTGEGTTSCVCLLSFLQAVFWFNPFIWLAFRQIRADMETACDSARRPHPWTVMKRAATPA